MRVGERERSGYLGEGVAGLVNAGSRREDDELQYAIRRLVEGLAATRETARPGFSLALAQLLRCNEDIPLQTILEQIKEKYNITKAKKALIRNAAFGGLFGILALSQSGRLTKEPNVLLQSIQLLQSLAPLRNHLSDLPHKTLVDILSETPEAIFKEFLFDVLKSDLSLALTSPEHLHLLLVALQRFPNVLNPQELKTLLGSTVIVTSENVPKLIELLKIAARIVNKSQSLPPFVMSLVHITLKEGTFETLWKEVVENSLCKSQKWPNCFLCFRLLGAVLPFLTLPQLILVLTGQVMRQYGNHVVSTPASNRFSFAPEMETYVNSFLEGIQDAEKQFTVITKFSCLTNKGYPVISSHWNVIHHLQPSVLLNYVSWLKNMFINPDLEACMDFSTKRQKEDKQQPDLMQHSVTRLQMWMVARLTSIVSDNKVKKEEDLVMDITRFIFFHAFFVTEQQTLDIPETELTPSIPLSLSTQNTIANSFFSLLNHLNTLPLLGNSTKSIDRNEKRTLGFKADGKLWIDSVVCYADSLLSKTNSIRLIRPFTQEQREAWSRMLKTVKDLQKNLKTSEQLAISVFQLLFLSVGIHLFKNGEESVALLSDLHTCLQKASAERERQSKSVTDEEEPEWVEVVVEILLSFLSQPSRLLRQISKTVFVQICPCVTKAALQLILDVLKPESESGEESAVTVTEEPDETEKVEQSSGDEMEDENDSDESEDEDDDNDDDSEEEIAEDEAVDDNFRMELMKVLQARHAACKEGESSDEEEVDDETMMALDKNISSLFAEHKKHLQAKKDQKVKRRKEKTLTTDFKMKVLDFIELFLVKQPGSPLVFDLIEPLIAIIEATPNSLSDKQEEDFLRKTADIFKNCLCKSKHYCRDIAEIKDDLHELIERLLDRACKQPDCSVSLYCFSGSLYLFRVLKGNPTEPAANGTCKEKEDHEGVAETGSQQVGSLGSVDIDRVTAVYEKALTLFMTKRNCSLTISMFINLFERFPVICKRLLQSAIKYMTDGVRHHQQGLACLLVQQALKTQEVKNTLLDHEGKIIVNQIINQAKQCLKIITKVTLKVEQAKIVNCLKLISILDKIVKDQKLNISMKVLVPVLQSLGQLEEFGKTSQVNNTYWHVMKLFGFKRPMKKVVKQAKQNPQAQEGKTLKKKKGFLPETKKRKNWKKKKGLPQEKVQEGGRDPVGKSGKVPKAAGRGQTQKQNKRKRSSEKGAKGNSWEKSGTPSKKAKLSQVEVGQGDKLGKQVTVKAKRQSDGVTTGL
ncbi:myb-binding protein 1A-like protein [Chiloscyllium plagiosum]|uniref:myb-binding protein 1A-like protein n=1 Tax=Chiloscyllium plagiosum TaxID=36176 RepID=UPI001CB823A6|nr:myb-binding protein 1A-like protein [Chiloscyllium plagiosum]